jgi:integrase/recombinase XerD
MSKREAPDGCFWRGETLWARIKIGRGGGQDIRFSLHTSNAKIAAQRRKAHADKLIGAVHHGEIRHSYQEAFTAWSSWIADQVGAKTVTRYAVSLGQLEPWLIELHLDEINGATVKTIVDGRKAKGASIATIRRDLTALSSVLTYAELEEWTDSNAALAWLRRLNETRDPIELPQEATIAAMLARAPGMFAKLIEAARLTGCRLEELTDAKRSQLDHKRRQLTIVGKGKKRRTIDLEPFGGYQALAALPAYVGSAFLFWHGAGEPYRNVSSRFAGLMSEIVAKKKSLQPFRFHDLRHLHAVEWLKSGRSIYDLQIRLGHSSIKTTEIYLDFLTSEEQRIVKYGAA